MDLFPISNGEPSNYAKRRILDVCDYFGSESFLVKCQRGNLHPVI